QVLSENSNVFRAIHHDVTGRADRVPERTEILASDGVGSGLGEVVIRLRLAHRRLLCDRIGTSETYRSSRSADKTNARAPRPRIPLVRSRGTWRASARIAVKIGDTYQPFAPLVRLQEALDEVAALPNVVSARQLTRARRCLANLLRESRWLDRYCRGQPPLP